MPEVGVGCPHRHDRAAMPLAAGVGKLCTGPADCRLGLREHQAAVSNIDFSRSGTHLDMGEIHATEKCVFAKAFI